jgi:hypothetical protein
MATMYAGKSKPLFSGIADVSGETGAVTVNLEKHYVHARMRI